MKINKGILPPLGRMKNENIKLDAYIPAWVTPRIEEPAREDQKGQKTFEKRASFGRNSITSVLCLRKPPGRRF
jgi:hypothetical protein